MKKIMILVVLFVVVASQLVVAIGLDKYELEWHMLTDQEKKVYLGGYFDGMAAIWSTYYDYKNPEYDDAYAIYELMIVLASLDNLIENINDNFHEDNLSDVWQMIYYILRDEVQEQYHR